MPKFTCYSDHPVGGKRALVAAGMSMLWVPQNPRAYPVYGYRGKGYNLMNVFDSNVGGAMVVVALP
ncbi:hypothetical protein Hanom_Chr06g00532271 [Helianthus anomalus]